MIKRLFVALFLMVNVVFASPLSIQSQLMDKVATAITGKIHPKACFISIDLSQLSFNNIIPSSCKNADIIFTNENILKYRKPLVAINLYVLTHNPYAVAGMYWLDGRYQVVFVKERLQEFNIHLPEEFRYYEVSQSSLY